MHADQGRYDMAVVGAGRYELGTEIARGAIGVVWRAVDTATGEPVAVKRLRPETAALPDSVVGFLGEAEILGQLRHPSVVRLRELVRESDGYALVLDFVDGQDLRRRVRAGGPLPPAVAVGIVAAIAEALGYVHGRGYVHGDIKPGNIVAPQDGSPVRLVDFGVARRVGQTDRATYATPEYVSPEVVLGGIPGTAADVYALGMVLYELCTGRSAFRGGGSDDVLRRHLTCVPVPPPGLAEPVWPVIQACLAFEPSHRPSAAPFANQLRALLLSLAGLPAPAPLAPDAVTWWPREADETAPILGLQRVVWMPANRQNPEAASPERVVAVPMPVRDGVLAPGGTPAGQGVEPLTAAVGALPPVAGYSAGAFPVGGPAGYDPAAGYRTGASGQQPGRSRVPLVIGVVVAVVVLLGLVAGGGYLLRDQIFGTGPVAGPTNQPTASTSPRPSGSPSPQISPSRSATASPSTAGTPGNPKPSGTVTGIPLPTGIPSIGAPLPTFP
jgi:serine/threonine-protein kinase